MGPIRCRVRSYRFSIALIASVALLACCFDPPRPEPVRLVDVGGSEPPTLSAPDLQVLLTIDDLPIAMRKGYRDDEERRETVSKLVELLNTRNIPFVGFFNMNNDSADPTLAQTWLTAKGMVVGNHTWSHPNARRTPLAQYLADLDRGHQAVAKLRPDQPEIPFRFPYLNQGFDPEKRQAIFDHLDELNSRHVPVTIDTSDWLYARGYLDALHKEDAETAQRWRQAWLWNIQESTIVAENRAEELFGRLPPQILLLHGNRLNADHLGQAIDWFHKRGYRFVTLDAALADAAYEEPDASVSPIGDSHWLRLRRSRLAEAPEEEPL